MHIAIIGAVGDHMIHRQFQVHECRATQGPMKPASALPGSASYGRNNTLLLRIGWERVDDVFALLGVDTDTIQGDRT